MSSSAPLSLSPRREPICKHDAAPHPGGYRKSQKVIARAVPAVPGKTPSSSNVQAVKRRDASGLLLYNDLTNSLVECSRPLLLYLASEASLQLSLLSVPHCQSCRLCAAWVDCSQSPESLLLNCRSALQRSFRASDIWPSLESRLWKTEVQLAAATQYGHLTSEQRTFAAFASAYPPKTTAPIPPKTAHEAPLLCDILWFKVPQSSRGPNVLPIVEETAARGWTHPGRLSALQQPTASHQKLPQVPWPGAADGTILYTSLSVSERFGYEHRDSRRSERLHSQIQLLYIRKKEFCM